MEPEGTLEREQETLLPRVWDAKAILARRGREVWRDIRSLRRKRNNLIGDQKWSSSFYGDSMTRQIIVKYCNECPYYDEKQLNESSSGILRCKMGHVVEDAREAAQLLLVPEWCGLENSHIPEIKKIVLQSFYGDIPWKDGILKLRSLIM